MLKLLNVVAVDLGNAVHAACRDLHCKVRIAAGCQWVNQVVCVFCISCPSLPVLAPALTGTASALAAEATSTCRMVFDRRRRRA